MKKKTCLCLAFLFFLLAGCSHRTTSDEALATVARVVNNDALELEFDQWSEGWPFGAERYYYVCAYGVGECNISFCGRYRVEKSSGKVDQQDINSNQWLPYTQLISLNRASVPDDPLRKEIKALFPGEEADAGVVVERNHREYCIAQVSHFEPNLFYYDFYLYALDTKQLYRWNLKKDTLQVVQ